jgi:hypothetical protein
MIIMRNMCAFVAHDVPSERPAQDVQGYRV